MTFSVLIVTAMYPHAEKPGSGAFVMHQVEQLRAMGHRVDVVHVKGYRGWSQYLFGALDVIRSTWRQRYDLVHVHYGLTGLCALVRWRTPMVVTLHGSDVLQGTFQPLVSRLVSAVASHTIVVSQTIAARCPGTLIPCGVDLDRFRPLNRRDARASLRLNREGKYILFPFDPARRVKRHDIASAAVALLRERGVDASLLAVWDVPNEQMPLYYAAADAMLLCSESEGSPTAVKEALACNLPVVSTDVGDVRFLLEGLNGAEICDRSASSIAAALSRVLDRISDAFDGRAAAARYDQETTGRKLLDVYDCVVRPR